MSMSPNWDRSAGPGAVTIRRSALLRRAGLHVLERGNGGGNAPLARFRLLRALDGLGMFALMRETQLLPPVPGLRRRFERLDEIGRRRDRARFGVELDPDRHAIALVHARSLAIAGAQPDPRTPAHRGDRRAKGEAVDRHLHRGTQRA